MAQTVETRGLSREQYEDALSSLTRLAKESAKAYAPLAQAVTVAEIRPKAVLLAFPRSGGDEAFVWVPRRFVGCAYSIETGHTVYLKRWFLQAERLWFLTR